jgi:hypothetical protein
MMVDSTIQNMQSNLEKLARLQEKTSSGKLFQKVSDDPVSAAFALDLRSSLLTAVLQHRCQLSRRLDEASDSPWVKWKAWLCLP